MTRYDPTKHHRRSIRLKGYDYAQAGAYFVTLCAQGHDCVFGEIVGDEMAPNAAGQIVAEEWMRTADVRPNVELDAFVVMPNHVHGIIVICDEDATVGATRRVAPTTRRVAPTTRRVARTTDAPAGPKSGSLGAIIGQFKSVCTKRINALRGTPGAPLWQRNYYERIIRNERELNAIRQYIANNPIHWALDNENPNRRR